MASLRGLHGSHRHNNPVAVGLQRVGMRLIQVKNNSRDRRRGRVLARAHAEHAIRVHFNFRGFAADRARKIQQDPVRIYRRLNRRLDGRTE